MSPYQEIRLIMNLSQTEVENVIKSLQQCDGLSPHCVYNTLTTMGLTNKELNFAFFLWGTQFGLDLAEHAQEDNDAEY
jgi:hypothetical protein